MLKGKIITDGMNYQVQVGATLVDVTDDVRALFKVGADEKLRSLEELRKKYEDVLQRYAQIESIVLAGGVGMPTG